MNSLVFSNMLHRPARTIVSIIGIGIGVMLIAFTIGLANGVLGQDLYAALLLVVLVTTLASPQLLKARFAHIRAAIVPPRPS